MKSVLESVADDFEIIVVDDGSVDQTGQILDQLAENHACLRVIHHPTNRGYAGALRIGFANATKDPSPSKWRLRLCRCQCILG